MAAPFPEVDAALAKIASDNPSTQLVEAAVKLLSTVVANIVKAPDEPKFRALKKSYKQVEASLLPCRGAVALLAAVGFRTETVEGTPKFVLAAERVDGAKLEYARSKLASGSVLEAKAAKAQGAVAAAKEAKEAAYQKQQAEKREDQRARERERQRVEQQRQEFLARQQQEREARAAAAAAPRPAAAAPAAAAPAAVAAPAAPAAAAPAAGEAAAASSSSRRKKAAPKRTAPAPAAAPAPDPAAAVAAAAQQAAASAASAAADAAEAEANKLLKRKQDAEFAAATAEFQGAAKKKRRTFTPEDAALRIKGTHKSQSAQDSAGQYGVVGRTAEASARQNAVGEGRFAITEKKVAAANGGGFKLRVVYRLANGKTEAEETVQGFDRGQLAEVFRHFTAGGTARSRSRRPQPERVAAQCASQAPEVWWSVVHAFAGDVVGGLEELLTPPPLTEAEGGGAA